MKDDVLSVNRKKRRWQKGVIIGLSIAVGVLGASTIGLACAYAQSQQTADNYGIQLENVYQKNLYDLVESVNNTETKLGKILASNSSEFQKKTLMEVSQNASLAQNCISSLPISQNELADGVKFINQMSGYTSTLADKLAKGGSLSSSDLNTLQKLYDSVVDMKNEVNDFVRKVQKNYSILDQSMTLDGEFNNFTIDLGKMKGDGVNYPAMIYDGPFSDAELDMTVKGLKGEELDKDQCRKEIEKTFKNYADIDYAGEINSRFETFTYHVTNTDSQKLFVQVSKIGGHILTVSGQGSSSEEKNITEDDAKKIAIDFAKENGVEDPEIVWQDQLRNSIYLNIAPKESGIVLYPDLVKVKVDLSSGTVIGYDATNYFLNHIPRALKTPSHKASDFKNKIPASYQILSQRLALAPLDYGREVVCFEYHCQKGGEEYYFYLNADTGEQENVLKVINTDDGSKLM